MVRSMTGYGRAELTVGNYLISVELKSVNHRYFEFNCRSPRGYGFVDDKLKSYVASRVGRGKIDAYVSIESAGNEAVEIDVNREYGDGYVAALKKLSEIYGLDFDVTVSTLARNPEMFTVNKTDVDEEKMVENILSVAEIAVDKFVDSRKAEGERMAADVKEKAEYILALVDKVDGLSANSVNTYRQNLENKIRELLEDTNIDEQRILTETAIFADKIAVDEETVRLKSHITELCSLLCSDEPIGRKLDFIVQEMNREANTMGSKSQEIEITRIVVDIKSAIEKIREQIQNIE